MNILVLLSIICGITTALHSQTLEWKKYEGLGGTGQYLASADTLFEYADTIRYSLDLGSSWHKYNRDTIYTYSDTVQYQNLLFRSVHLNSKSIDFYNGEFRYVQVSTDKGLSWQRINIGSTTNHKLITYKDSLVAICRLTWPDTIGVFSSVSGLEWSLLHKVNKTYYVKDYFAVGTKLLCVRNDSLFRSTNYGLTFEPCTFNGKSYKAKTYCVSDSAIIVVVNDTVYISRDEGLAWGISLIQKSLNPYGITQLKSYHNSIILLRDVCTYGIRKENKFQTKLNISTDNGTTWKLLDTIVTKYFGKVDVLNSNVIVTTSSYNVHISTDVGLTWVTKPGGNRLGGILLQTPKKMYLRGALLRYEDVLNQWRPASDYGNIDFVYENKDTILLHCSLQSTSQDYGAFILSLDSGSTFKYFEEKNYFEYGFGSIVVNSGKIFGEWYGELRTISFSDFRNLERVYFNGKPMSSGGKLISSKFGVFDVLGHCTSDGGESWYQIKFPYDMKGYGTLSTNGEQIYLTDVGGNIFKSDNGCKDWTKVHSFPKVGFTTFELINSYKNHLILKVITIDTSSPSRPLTRKLYYSTDYGYTFTELPNNLFQTTDWSDVFSVEMNSQGVFLAVNSGLYLAKYPDGSTDVTELPSGIVSITPNPTTDNFTIHSVRSLSDRTILIYDYLGRVIKTIQLPSNEEELVVSCTEIPNGIYTITLQSGVTTQSRTIVISR